MREHPDAAQRSFTWPRVVVTLAVLAALSFVPWADEPSMAGWLQAYVRGKGTAHFPLAGAPAGRVGDFFKRHPDLLPEWREVPAKTNGHLLLRGFVKSDAATQMRLSDDLGAMLRDETKWDEDAVKVHLETHRQALNELRRIALLPERSAQGVPGEEFLDSRAYKQMADVLLLSFRHHLRAQRMDDALKDFSAIHGFAAHLDRHEVPDFLDKTVGILVRLAPHGVLCQSLKDTPVGTDWSPWIRTLQNEPSYAVQMEAVWRGEVWSTVHNIHFWHLAGETKNPIWDFKKFEDAYAHRMRASAKPFAGARRLVDLGSLQKLEDAFAHRESALSKAAREGLGAIHIGMRGWAQGSIRADAQTSRTLAALQLLQAERAGGPITDAADPRLAPLAIDPSDGLPFPYDPASRQLSASAGSALKDEPPVQLPPAPSF